MFLKFSFVVNSWCLWFFSKILISQKVWNWNRRLERLRKNMLSIQQIVQFPTKSILRTIYFTKPTRKHGSKALNKKRHLFYPIFKHSFGRNSWIFLTNVSSEVKISLTAKSRSLIMKFWKLWNFRHFWWCGFYSKIWRSSWSFNRTKWPPAMSHRKRQS